MGLYIEYIVAFGLVILAGWLLRNNLALSALDSSKPRRNSMPAVLPVVMLFMWFGSSAIAMYILQRLTTDIPKENEIFRETVTIGIVNLILALFMVLVINRQFARGIKGLGLSYKKISKDIVFSIMNLFAAWPLILVVLAVTTAVLKLIVGADYNIQPHQELEVLVQYNQPHIQIAILISGAVITPFLEEVLFRGLIQSLIRSYVIKPWLSIVLAAVVFSIAHGDPTHWPAIFVLGVTMGYSYEKSGSLWRPMFIHALFNGSAIVANMIPAQ